MKPWLQRHNKSGWAKFAVFFGSLVVSLALLELGLRTAGRLFESGRQRDYHAAFADADGENDYVFERYRAGKAARLILTMGDSLTNGTNVSDRETYPYHLYRLFAERGEKTSVINMGYCEETTFGVSAKLKEYLAQKDARVPDAVVVLAGASDLFYLPLVGLRTGHDVGVTRDVLPRNWVGNLRLLKVLRHITMTLPLRLFGRGLDEEDSVQDAKLRRLLEIYQSYKKNAGSGEPRPLGEEAVRELSVLFSNQLRTENFDLKRPAQFLEFTADYAYETYGRRGRHDELFGLLLDMAERFPATFWRHYATIADLYFPMSYKGQSRYPPEDVLKVLDRTAAKHPALLKEKPFAHFRNMLRDRKKTERLVVRKRLETLGEMVRLCKENGIRLVLQTYPASYKSANASLREIAAKHRIPLVDNERRFAKLIRGESRSKYASGNDHLTAIGYEIMARNVFETLTRESFPASEK